MNANASSGGKDVPCAFCGTTVVGKDFVLCPSCEVPTHRECWAANGKCPAYACGAIDPLEPALAIFRRPQSAQVVASTAPALPAILTATAGSVGAAIPATPPDPREAIRILEARLSRISRKSLRQSVPFLGGIACMVAGLVWGWPLLIGGSLGATLAYLAWTIYLSRDDMKLERAIRFRLLRLREEILLAEEGLAPEEPPRQGLPPGRAAGSSTH